MPQPETMSEASVFDSYRAKRALDGRLAADERIELVAIDAITGDYWVLTTARLVVLHDEQIAAAVPRAALNGEVRTAAAGVEVRVRTEDGGVLIAGFRSANKLVDRLKTLLRPPGEAAPDPS